ncbi:MAG: enoyl-CoA hydratase-related protein [Chloroflexota bacterium]|nr:enoyl-CoA hydratase-related protein [Chloroflexota bacterium]
MSYEDIIYEKGDGVATVTMNRPTVLNAFRTQTVLEMTAALDDAAHDQSVGVIVVTGAGERAFCVGGDIAEMRDLTPESGRLFLRRFARLLWRIRQAPQPVIAAVRGYCLGGGNEINVACDLTLAAGTAVFGQVGPTVGSAPVLGGAQFLPGTVGEKRAREIIFLCQRYPAAGAERFGWVNKVVPDDEFETALRAWTERILELSPQSLRVSKIALNYASDELRGSFNTSIEMLSALYGSDEFREGMTAFLEKRKPDFRNARSG